MARLAYFAGLAIILTQAASADDGVSIRNFRAVPVSGDQLQVTVDYNFPTDMNAQRWIIRASPSARSGASIGGFESRVSGVQSGSHTVTLTLVKSPNAPDVTTDNVRICISTKRNSLLCQDFPYVKTWASYSKPPPPPQQCSVRGTLYGSVVGLAGSDRGQSSSDVKLTHVTLRPDGNGPPLQAPIYAPQRGNVLEHKYFVDGLTAGVTYRIRLNQFRSDPAEAEVMCRAGEVHNADFYIFGPRGEG